MSILRLVVFLTVLQYIGAVLRTQPPALVNVGSWKFILDCRKSYRVLTEDEDMCMERRALVPFFVAHTPVIKLLELLQNLTDSSMIQAMFRRVIDRQEPFPALRIVFSHLLHSPLLMLQHVTKCWKPWKH